jgi:phosphatidate cytidylyltransferase
MWSDLPRRLTTISLGVPLILYILSSSRTALLFFQCVHLLACIEWTRLAPSQKTKTDSNYMYPYLFVAASMVLAHLPSSLLVVGMVLSMALLYLVDGPKHRALHGHGLLFITLPFSVWYQVSQDMRHTVTLLFIVWNCDTGALVAGRCRQMAFQYPPAPIPWLHAISPAKTMVGMGGGVLLGTLTTLLIPSLWNATRDYFLETDSNSWWLESPWDGLWNRTLLGISLSLLAILGDLVESAVKRQAGKKDTGKLLPGHGGVLDRFDSSLLAVVAYQYICMKT